MKFHQLDISLGWSITSTGQLYEKTLGFRHLRACCTLRAYPDAEKRRLAYCWTLGNPQGWLKSWWTTREEEEVSMVDTGQGHHDVFFSFILRHNQLWFEVYPTQVSFQPFAFFLTRKVAWDWTPWMDSAATTFENLDPKISLVSKAPENLQWWSDMIYVKNFTQPDFPAKSFLK